MMRHGTQYLSVTEAVPSLDEDDDDGVVYHLRQRSKYVSPM